ncbi:MAG TPA: hypothetical protein VNH65_22285 [Candidatus Acidoferrum sp.]|nr:hypothetical protein [Candidatus Acidoferrum sp.]
MKFRDRRKGQFEWRITIAPLLGDRVVLLAMKHRRAPLPVSSALWKGLQRKGFPNGLDELAIFARRYQLLGGRAAAASRTENSDRRTHARARDIVKAEKVATEDRPQIKDAQICP